MNVPVNEPVNDPVLICRDEDTVPAGSPVGRTYDAVIATDAVRAHDAVPNRDEVIPTPTTMRPLDEMRSEPVMTALPLNGNPCPFDVLMA